MARMSFGGVFEEIVTREEYSLDCARETLQDEQIVVVGYGVQGPAQGLNLRDNGFDVRIGLPPERKRSWGKATDQRQSDCMGAGAEHRGRCRLRHGAHQEACELRHRHRSNLRGMCPRLDRVVDR